MSSPVSRMFASIAGRYDLANDVLSLGIHRLWQRELIRRAGLSPAMHVLDCATGTGALALALKRCVTDQGEVRGIDFCEPMLDIARRRAQRAHLNITFEFADLLDLPYADGTFDAATVAFGIRNVIPPVKGLASMARVVKPGGRVLVLEFGMPINKTWRSIYGAYSRYFIPRVGGLLTGNRSAYAYLHSTSTTFPCGDAFLRLLRQAGRFSRLEAVPLSGGIAYLYCGVVAGAT
jgi:demethylmenaquinone methyltransferase / 2-methoxy-6-polyprenyl-1,4-benzoquinol methylase